MSDGPATSAKPHTGERPRSPPQAAASAKLARATWARRMRKNLIDVDKGDRHGAHRLECARRIVVEIVECVGDEHAQARRPARPTRPQVQHFDGDPGIRRWRELDALESTAEAEVCTYAEVAHGVVRRDGDQVARAKGERALRKCIMGELAGVEERVGERAGEMGGERIRAYGKVESREATTHEVLELDHHLRIDAGRDRYDARLDQLTRFGPEQRGVHARRGPERPGEADLPCPRFLRHKGGVRDHPEPIHDRRHEPLRERWGAESAAGRRAPSAARGGEDHANPGADDGAESAAVDGEEIDARPAREAGGPQGPLPFAVRRVLPLAVGAEDVARDSREPGLPADRDDAAAAVGAELTAELAPEAIAYAKVVSAPRLEIGEVGAQPRGARLPVHTLARRARQYRREIALVGAGMVPQPTRVDQKRLVSLAAVLAATALAPGERLLILVARPGAGDAEPRVRARLPLALTPELPVVAMVLLAVAVGAPPANGDRPAQLIPSVARGETGAALDPGEIAEAPLGVGWVGIRATGEPQASVEAERDVARDEVHHAAEGSRPVQGRACPFHNLDALDVIHREQIPVDAAAVALVGGNAVHQQQDPAAEALYKPARAADIDLAREELDPGRLVDGFIDRVDGALGDVGVGHQSHAWHDVLERLGAFGGGDDDLGHDKGRRDENSSSPESEVAPHRVRSDYEEAVRCCSVADHGCSQFDASGLHPWNPICASPVRHCAEPLAGDKHLCSPDRATAGVRDGAVDDSITLSWQRARSKPSGDQKET